ncbi:hypothetical protein C8Q79DRAFT_323040 [Trametes meyenii]|nr:hypothetical protein C8Q79DRAFT_323040 [Trametes meyenii]
MSLCYVSPPPPPFPLPLPFVLSPGYGPGALALFYTVPRSHRPVSSHPCASLCILYSIIPYSSVVVPAVSGLNERISRIKNTFNLVLTRPAFFVSVGIVQCPLIVTQDECLESRKCFAMRRKRVGVRTHFRTERDAIQAR